MRPGCAIPAVGALICLVVPTVCVQVGLAAAGRAAASVCLPGVELACAEG